MIMLEEAKHSSIEIRPDNGRKLRAFRYVDPGASTVEYRAEKQ